MAQEIKPFTYKENYLIEVEKVSKGVYNYTTTYDNKIIIQEENLKKKTMFKVGDYIRAKIDEYEVEAGIETPVEEEEEESEEGLDETEEMQKAIDEVKAEQVDLEEEVDDEYELLKGQYEAETGKKAITTRGTERKEFIKWKKLKKKE